MSPEEFSNQFDVLYNNITSNQAPGLNEYEKSVFLTKGQDETLKNHFLAQSNPKQAGFDDNQKRQIDFSSITKVASYVSGFTYTPTAETDGMGHTLYTRAPGQATTTYSYSQAYDENGSSISDRYIRETSPSASTLTNALYDGHSNSKCASLPSDILMIINEKVTVYRGSVYKDLMVVPLKYGDYDRLMSKPFQRPLKNQAWRLINSNSGNKADLIVGPGDIITNYTLRYVKRPNPIIVGNLDGLTINGIGTVTACELDPILHEEILQRAVELAKVAWTQTGQDNTQAVIAAGQRSE